MSESLSVGQQILNQRLLAEHCLTEEETQELYASVAENCDEQGEGSSLADTLASCNAQLQYLGLEIVAVNLPNHSSSNDENSKNNNSKHQRYYAMVNKFPDDIAKAAFQAHLFQPPQQQAYVKAVLQKLVEDDTATRAVLLNLRNDLDKLPLAAAEDALERLLEEKWLTECCAGAGDNGKNNKRRGSNAAEIRLGARAYCELSYMLTDEFGMDPNDLPQQILLR